MPQKVPTCFSLGTILTFLVAVIIIGSPMVSFVGSASAQEQLDIKINAPSEANTGDSVTVSSTISVPDLVGEYESDISIVLSVDGEQVATKTGTVEDGETTTVSFGHTFTSSGTHTIAVRAELTLGGQTFSNSLSRTIDITAPETTTPTTTPVISADSQITINGAAFATPESLKDEIQTYRNQARIELARNAFVIGTEDELYLVFTNAEPQKGLATVNGLATGKEISVQDHTFNIIVASSTSFQTKGSTATISEVTRQQEAYSLDLVRIQANHRQISSVTDTDQGNDPTFAISTGMLVDAPATSEMFNQPGRKAASLLLNASSDKLGATGQSETQALLNGGSNRLVTVDFQTRFWRDTDTTVDGIVLTPGSKAREFVSSFDRKNLIPAESGQPLLYVVGSGTDSTQYESVSALRSQATDGDVVTIRANLLGQRMSIQETLEHSTPCSQEAAQVPTPSGPICVDVVQDTLIHTGVAWTSVPETEEELLLVVGLSSQELDTPVEPFTGEYRIVGELISTSRFDDSLPESHLLIIYDLERVGESDYPSISSQNQVLIDSRFEELHSSVESQINGSSTKELESPQDDESTQLDGSNNSGQQSSDKDDESFFGIDFPDWLGGDKGGVISDIIDGIRDIFGSGKK